VEWLRTTVQHIAQALSGFWRPTAVALCGLVILLCWPTLQAAAQMLASDILHYDQETDPFTRFVGVWTHHALLLSLALLCLLIVAGAISVLVMIVYTEIRRQRKRQRDYDRRSTRQRVGEPVAKLPEVIPIDAKRRSA
jgi:hypothetical protein